MPQITINVPDDQVTRINDAFAARNSWVPGSGITKTQNAKQQVIAFIRDVVKQREIFLAEEAARTSASQAAMPELT